MPLCLFLSGNPLLPILTLYSQPLSPLLLRSCSGYTGENLLTAHPLFWWTGGSLVEAIDFLPAPNRDSSHASRFIISDVIKAGPTSVTVIFSYNQLLSPPSTITAAPSSLILQPPVSEVLRPPSPKYSNLPYQLVYVLLSNSIVGARYFAMWTS